MLVALILVSIGFAVTLGILLFGGSNRAALPSSSSSSVPSARNELESESQRRAKAETELQRKQKELDEQRTQLQDVKEQLKQAKRKLFEQKEADKGPQDLAKARAEAERAASLQLEQTREELAHVLSENQRLKAEMESRGRRPQPAAPAPAVAAAAPVTPAQQLSAPAKEGEPVVVTAVAVTPAADAAREDRGQRRFRELNDADREKMERLEQLANKERSRAVELEKELRRVKGRTETQQRVYASAKSDLDLMRDKYKALEKRLNRTLLERDLLRRAIKDLEKKTGMLADRTELTPEEMAASDQRTEETARVRAETEAQSAARQAPAEPTSSTDTATTEAAAVASDEQKPAPV